MVDKIPHKWYFHRLRQTFTAFLRIEKRIIPIFATVKMINSVRIATHVYLYIEGVKGAHYKLDNIKRKDYTI